MEVNESKNTKVMVTIFGEEYLVKGRENPEYIEMLAAFVDRNMRLVQQRNATLSTTKIAVLTALNLADELNRMQEDYDELVRELEELRSRS